MKTLFRSAIAAALAAMLVAPALADRYVGGDLTLTLNEDDDVSLLAADVTLTGRVGGDVEGAAADITIDAEIGGDVDLAAADVQLDGRVGGDVSVLAADFDLGADVRGDVEAAVASASIFGRVMGDVSLAADQIRIDEDAVIAGDLRAAASDLTLSGQINGDVEVNARDVRITGRVAGALDIRAEQVVIDASAELVGPISLRGPNPPRIADGAQIGEVDYSEGEYRSGEGPDIDVNVGLGRFGFGAGPALWVVAAVFASSALFLGLFAAVIAPNSVGSIALAFRKRPWVAGLLGLVIFAALPVVVITLFVLLLVTVIGIPLAFILIFAFPILYFLAFIFGGVVIGDMMLNRSGARAGLGLRLGSFLLALLLIVALSAVPVVGFAVAPIVLCIGFGAWTLAIFSRHGNGAAPATPSADAV